MTNELSIKQAILARSTWHPDLWLKNYISDEWGEIISQPCPKCGSHVGCAYAEMGAIDFDHNWAHACLNPACDYIEEVSRFESSYGYLSPGMTEAPLTCPMCGR